MKIKELKILMINTDGLTIKVKRDKIDAVEAVNEEWMKSTKLDLERADYSRFFLRDCNNFIAEYCDEKETA